MDCTREGYQLYLLWASVAEGGNALKQALLVVSG